MNSPALQLLPLCLVLLGGCASLPAGRGQVEVHALVEARGLPQVGATQGDLAALVAPLKQAPLGLAQAVQLALVNNPRVVQGYARLGLAAAEVYDAGRLSNPQFSTAVMTPEASVPPSLSAPP